MTSTHTRALIHCGGAAVALALALLPVAGCGGGARSHRAAPANAPTSVLLDDVADAGDHAGTIAAFEKRLARLDPADAQYAPTLERLALAHLEWADELAATAPADARLQRQAAVTRYLDLTRDFPDYEGTPAALFLLAGEQRALEDETGARTTLEQLVARYGATHYALQARLLLVDLALRDNDLHRAATLLDESIVQAEPASELALYARYQRARVHVLAGEPQAAIDRFAEVLRSPDLPARLASQVRNELVDAMTLLPRPADPAAALRPYAGDDPAELERMVQRFEDR